MPPSQHDWVQTCIRTILWAHYGLIMREVWANRQSLKNLSRGPSTLLDQLRSILSVAKPSAVDTLRRSRLTDVRMRSAFKGLSFLQLVVHCVLIAYVFRYSIYEQSHKQHIFQIMHIVVASLVYFGFRVLLAYPLTQRRIDGCFVFWSLLITFRRPYLSIESFIMYTPLWIAIRTFVSVVYMRSRVSTLVNLLHALVECWTFVQRPIAFADVSLSPLTFCGVQLLTWACTSSMCIVTEVWFNELIEKEMVANSAKHAVERLLSGLSDAVVRLDPTLSISKATPQLMHLMCPTTPMDPRILEGSLFSTHLATDLDRERCDAFISNGIPPTAVNIDGSTTVPARALRVNMHHALGCEVPVELYHVYSEGISQELEHLIGIREVREQGSSPDESLFQGRKVEFTHPGQAESPEVGVQREVASETLQLPQQQNLQSPRSSSRSSSLASSDYSAKEQHVRVKRGLKGLHNVNMKLDVWRQYGSYVGIEEYCLTFIDEEGFASRLPDFDSCLIGEGAAAFTKWVQATANRMVHSKEPAVVYSSPVFFRPPDAAFTSSKVILCAESARMTLSSEELDPDENDYGNELVLEFFDISHVVARSHSRHGHLPSEFPSLSEAMLSKLSAPDEIEGV